MNNDNKNSIEIIDSGDLEYVTGGYCGSRNICTCDSSGGGGADAV